jgi:chromosome segregation ATPase
MRHYNILTLGAIALLIVGATSPASDKELIIRLQGEVIVLQRQIRDLQESFDKWQGQSNATLQKLQENTSSSAGSLTSIEDSLRTQRSAQTNNLAGTNAQLQRIADQLSRQEQNFSNIIRQIDILKDSVRDYQQKVENSVKRSDSEPTPASPESLNAALREYDRILTEIPKSEKTPYAMLKKGTTLLQLERREEGIEVLKSLISQYPNSQEATLARNELNRLGENASVPPLNRQRPE